MTTSPWSEVAVGVAADNAPCGQVTNWHAGPLDATSGNWPDALPPASAARGRNRRHDDQHHREHRNHHRAIDFGASRRLPFPDIHHDVPHSGVSRSHDADARQEELAKDLHESRWRVVGVQAARVGQHPHPRAADLGSSRRRPDARRRWGTRRCRRRPPAWLAPVDLRFEHFLPAPNSSARSDAAAVARETRLVMPSPHAGSETVRAERRGVKPGSCRAGQKRLPGRAKRWPTVAEKSPGLMPTNSTASPGATHIRNVVPIAVWRSAFAGFRPPSTI